MTQTMYTHVTKRVKKKKKTEHQFIIELMTVGPKSEN
jgi:hypothetical protein